jgi:hypothetical protein
MDTAKRSEKARVSSAASDSSRQPVSHIFDLAFRGNRKSSLVFNKASPKGLAEQDQVEHQEKLTNLGSLGRPSGPMPFALNLSSM